MNIEEIKMDHFENFEELIKTCKMWIRDDDIDAYYRFFEFNCMKALVTAYEKEKETSHYNQNQLDIANAKLVEEKERNKELEKMLNLKSHKRRYNTMNYIKKNKLNKFDTVGICQDMRAFKRTGEIKYRAYITFQNKQYTLGTYTSLDKAKEARKKGEMMVENIKKNFVEKIKGEE